VDTTDEIIHASCTKAASRRWPLALPINLLDNVALDAYTICENVQITTKKFFFIIEPAEKLFSAEENYKARRAPHISEMHSRLI